VSPTARPRAGRLQTWAAGPRDRVPSAPRIRPPRRRRRGCRTARRSGSPARPRSSRCRTAARRARRSCRARDRSRRAAPRARGARSPAAGSLVLLGQAVDEGLEIVRGGAPRKRTPVHEEARRAPHAERLAFLYARLEPRDVALAVHTGVVLVEVEPEAPSEVAEQRARVLPRLGPLVVGEQLVVHLPELALLSGALGGHGRVARPPPRATGRTLSFVPSPPPRFVVLVVVESGGGVARSPLRLVHDAPTLRGLRRIVRHSHLIVKQLAPRVPQEFLELRRSLEQPARPVQRLNALGQRAQHGEQALGAVRSVHFFRVIAHVPTFPDVSTARPPPHP